MRLAFASVILGLLVLPALAQPVDAGVTSTPAWGPLATATIRPGASLGGYCTFNFLFYDASNAYIGTAGHCTDKIGERVELGSGAQIGTVVYDSDKTAGADEDVDFSLIRLDADRVDEAHPQMLGFFGPTGIAPRAELTQGETLNVYGYGLVVGETGPTRARSGVLVGTTPTLYRADMPAVNGDSGAPLLEAQTGRAMGIISHYGLNPIVPTTDEGPLMTFVLDELDRAGFDVTLATV